MTCVFCGHEYPTGTPRSQAKALADHVAVCEKHPAAAFRKRAEKAEEEARIWREKYDELQDRFRRSIIDRI